MKKILLIGKLGNIVKNLNECLIHDFQIQICPNGIDSVQPMVKIVKPDLIMLCHIGSEDAKQGVLEWLACNCKDTPVMVITTQELWSTCANGTHDDKVTVMYRPILKSQLIDKCHELIRGKNKETDKGNKDKDNADRKKIMIVDDSVIMLRTMKVMLDKDFDICLAKSGEQAINLIPSEKPDLILLDYEMDGMNGKETFEKMKADECMKNIPVVFLTSMTDKKIIYSVLKSKPNGYILKPPDKEKILDTIEEVFGKEK